MEVIGKRRSIRSFRDQSVEAEKIERILQAGMQAPSAHNSQPWEFLVVIDKEAKVTIAQMSPYAGPAKAAPVVIIVMANLETAKAVNNLWWQQDVSACTQNMLLQIAAEELGGVWLGFYPDEERAKKVQTYFNLPDHILPFSVIPFGYSAQENQFVDRFDKTKIHWEKY